ncbi:MAG: GNAT family N-acetyltransferase [Alphaproteobacteria bacterium]|jgi:[ribosomal protein S5]-alanine N-acetyltransferase|nr:GNAT family N-acetyltransferase [Alphaproteobacteria bacterium]MBU0802477.1 GNAT family N-acetyltransferase [Alphaproteobacteria bacterium]MBU0873956.1 GNAT family N-acetyltransferase [Alphaproteobacteria bacterium]MBU1400544.1 GNAT family N-acetyltransferase [Alphaproteobacteria bacterium]MBU1590417.1 GNAT family N-acetyltransferase [Alphaproteobacteria bacterium]
MFGLSFLQPNQPELRGERVSLRMPVRGDYREWADLRGASRQFLEPWEPRWAADELGQAAWRHRLYRYRKDFADGTAIAFFIFDTQTGHLLGGITLGNIRRGVAQSGHIGYWLGEKNAGKGLMVDALGLLSRHAFETIRLHRVEAACIPGNTRSVRVLEKAGFTREGLLRSYLKINGTWQDHYLYGLVSEDRRSATAKD